MAHRLAAAQPPKPALSVLPRGVALVQDYRALHETGTNRFLGWKFDPTLGPEFTDPVDGQKKHHGGRVKQTDREVVIPADDPFYHEYVVHLKHGDLWAADLETAKVAGVPLEPHFLGEHPAVSAKHGVEGAKLSAALKDLGFPNGAPDPSLPWDTDFKPIPPGQEPAKPAAPAASK